MAPAHLRLKAVPGGRDAVGRRVCPVRRAAGDVVLVVHLVPQTVTHAPSNLPTKHH